jgi:transcriptional regulator with XRE-family HTH domain
MANRERQLERASWLIARDLRIAGEELRRARRAAGLTLQEVADVIRAGRSTVLRVERAQDPGVHVGLLARHAAAVGMRLRISAFPEGSPLHDAGQLELIRRFRLRIGAVGRWEIEVPLPIPGDRRAIDAVLTLPAGRVGLEFVTRMTDAQAQIRSATLKRRDASLDRMVLVVQATTANRRALRAMLPAVEEALPVATRTILHDLERGRMPAYDGIVLL